MDETLNANPIIYSAAVSERLDELRDEEVEEEIDALEVFGKAVRSSSGLKPLVLYIALH